ncbi:subtilisin-like protein [Russula aff. rugulosa BPL654]|nr:subtilisin-like protein [Russula aff. rugulosa BPL654]
MRWLSVLSVLVTVPLGLATPLTPRWDDMRVKHSWGSIPNKWDCQGHPPTGTTIDLRIALKPHREGALIDALYEVSDPNHAKYGAHLSKEQVAELVAPHPDSLELLGSWFEHHEVPTSAVSITHGGGWLTIKNVPLTKANALLGASYQNYRHTETNETVIRTVGYSLPAALHQHVQTVAPTTYFGSPRPLRQTSKLAVNAPTLPDGDPELQDSSAIFSPGDPVPDYCSRTITPTCLRLLYKTWAYEPQAMSKNKIGITGYLEQYASQSDLTMFLTRFRTDAATANFSFVSVNGGINDQSQPGTEANLDTQYAESITYPTPNIFYSTAGSPPYEPDEETLTNSNEPYLDWLDFIMTQKTIPQTISTSYGDDEQTVPLDYAESVCNMFCQLGTMGVSILFSSGDSGVGGGSCLSNDGTNSVKFTPAFPASCPFVTTVGGTTQVSPEVAVNFSGGGFSNYFPRPSYQDTAVLSYLNVIGSQYSGLFNTNGRAYPDISAQAMNFQVVLAGKVVNVGGTSAACPTAASVISLLNDFLISRGNSPLGFLNPLIYFSAAGFNDITSGSNPGCGTQGFLATEGWDPVTGMGTPDFEKLMGILG